MKIGFLLPNSRYYPYIGSDLYNSVKFQLGDQHRYIFKDTKFGTPNDNQLAAKELILYDNVDIIVGFIGYRSIMALKPLVEQTRTPLIMCNAGEHPLLKDDISPYIIHISLGLFNSVYLATKWALQNIGKSYSFLSSFFEAGYPILMAVDTASKQYSGNITNVSITHKDADPKIKQSCELMGNNSSDFIFMAYHGFEAIETYKYVNETNCFNDKILLTTPFVSELETSKNNTNKIISVKTWLGNNVNQLSRNLNDEFKNELKRDCSVFGSLGFEAATIISDCIKLGWCSKEEIPQILTNYKMESPRGIMSFNPLQNNFLFDYYLETKDVDGVPQYKKIFIEPGDGIILNEFDKELSGWINTYLCN